MPPAHPKNAPGPWYVEDGCCLACAVPVDTAPALFAFDTDANGENLYHCFVIRQPRTPAERELMLEAASVADLECIRYRGREPDVLARLLGAGLARLVDPPKKA